MLYKSKHLRGPFGAPVGRFLFQRCFCAHRDEKCRETGENENCLETGENRKCLNQEKKSVQKQEKTTSV